MEEYKNDTKGLIGHVIAIQHDGLHSPPVGHSLNLETTGTADPRELETRVTAAASHLHGRRALPGRAQHDMKASGQRPDDSGIGDELSVDSSAFPRNERDPGYVFAADDDRHR